MISTRMPTPMFNPGTRAIAKLSSWMQFEEEEEEEETGEEHSDSEVSDEIEDGGPHATLSGN